MHLPGGKAIQAEGTRAEALSQEHAWHVRIIGLSLEFSVQGKREIRNQRWLGVSHILLLQTMLKSINFYRYFT